MLWSFSPEKRRGVAPVISHAIADDRFLYAVGTIGKAPAAWKVDWSGKETWSFDSRVDIQRGHWPTLGLGSLLMYDDGLYLIDPETGRNRRSRYLDAWGQSLSDGSRFYVVNSWHVDGPPVLVGALDSEGNELWRRFPRGRTFGDVMDLAGAIALDGGSLFYGADYQFQHGSMIAALAPDSGEVKWQKPTRPASAMSAVGGRLFVVEKADRQHRLVARSQADGETVWSVPIEEPATQAPAVAGNTVIVESSRGLQAFEGGDGKALWSATEGTRSATQTPWATTIAVASGTGTLIVTRGRHLHVLRVADGTEAWRSGPVATFGDLHSPVLVGERLLVVEGTRLLALEPGG